MQGKIYLIKDGFIDIHTLNYSKELLQKAKDTQSKFGFDTINSDEEQALGITKVDNIQVYNNYLEQGYSIVRTLPYWNFDEPTVTALHTYYLDITIGNNYTEHDYRVIKRLLLSPMIPNNITSTCIWNIRDNDYDQSHYFHNLFDTSKAFSYFSKEKLHQLTVKEAELMHQYRTFSLDQLLFNTNISENIINNHNCGVIVVTPKQTITKTVTKLFHDAEVNAIMKKLTGHEFPELELWEKAQFGIIIGQIFFHHFVLWIPPIESLNQYQKTYLQEQAQNLSTILTQGHRQPNDIVIAVFEVDSGNNREILPRDNSNNPLEDFTNWANSLTLNKTKAKKKQ